MIALIMEFVMMVFVFANLVLQVKIALLKHALMIVPIMENASMVYVNVIKGGKERYAKIKNVPKIAAIGDYASEINAFANILT